MFPVIAKDLNLSYADIGIIAGALAFAWGSAALFMGNLSDRIGRKTVLLVSLIVFSLLIGSSGLANGLASLVLVRVLMGFADGAFTPASIHAAVDASPAKRHGMSVGLQQSLHPLLGLGLCPIIVAQLLHFLNWRMVFSVFTIPGLVVALLIWKIIPSKAQEPVQAQAPPRSAIGDWKTVFRFTNVRIAMVMMLCWLTCLITTSALLPSYLTDYLHLNFSAMSQIMSAIGLGAVLGTVVLPALSDRFGRRPIIAASTAGGVIALLMFINAGASPLVLFLLLAAIHFFNFGLLTMTIGPLCSEAVPTGLRATATGVVIAAGEFFGGGLAPIGAGYAAVHFGIQSILWFSVVAMVIGFILSLMLRPPQRGELTA